MEQTWVFFRMETARWLRLDHGAMASWHDKDELLCTYAALVLHDDGAEITPAAMTNLIKAICGVSATYRKLQNSHSYRKLTILIR